MPDHVRVRVTRVALPTYEPAAPDRHPMFLEQRVYQGSSGRVYPLPVIDRIATTPRPRRWTAIHLENRYLRVMLLPEIGGRIHLLQDKTNGYDLIYHQTVIKPALVGLAGPWISGGIEFNWPQHHRPGTFLPTRTHIERHPDGRITAWCGDHDPLGRLQGMHGVCLHPDQALLELQVRVFNRTPFVQTFLWWANVAVRVRANYQSFFPPDVRAVADHAKRATSDYPECRGIYYGVDYGARARSRSPGPAAGSGRVPRPANDLSWYANIPTPCSYMALGSQQDFFGGYDHDAEAGLVHVANHHIAPGKKQWTWGNHAFGQAWDRQLTDPDARGHCAPYIELMAGVYTDNQPDFAFLQPGETRTWSQFWYPIQKIRPPHQANTRAAVRLDLGRRRFRLGVCVTAPQPGARIVLERRRGAAEWRADLAPGRPFLLDSAQARRPWTIGSTTLRVLSRTGEELIRYAPTRPSASTLPPSATAPPPPRAIASADELFLTGLHLQQYRHATRCPTPYWREALRRDPGDARCHNALGLWHLRRGEFQTAASHFQSAIERLTARNPNPADGEPFYNLGLCLRFQLDAAPPGVAGSSPSPSPSPLLNLRPGTGARRSPRATAAYAAFYKAAWNGAWQAAAFYALAEMDCRQADWPTALDHLERALRVNADQLQARNLQSMVLRQLRRRAAAADGLRQTLALDPLDAWARHLAGRRLDPQTAIDVAVDLARAGWFAEAIRVLDRARPDPGAGAEPLRHYHLAGLCDRLGRSAEARDHRRRAAAASPDYCFPARLEELAVLQAALRANPRDARAAYYLGNWLYDRRRHADAIECWEQAAALDPRFPVVWRNLGLAYYNVRHAPAAARRAYERAHRADPADARVLYERDQLWKRLGVSPSRRRRELERHPGLVASRDDLSLELAALCLLTRSPDQALARLASRRFQPWEGGEGMVLGVFVRARLTLGRRALAAGNPQLARTHFERALQPPENLGEARHPLANPADIHYWLGRAWAAEGDDRRAREQWRLAARQAGDFQEMTVREFSEMTYYRALALAQLGQTARSRQMFRRLRRQARELARAPAEIDYFATSLPNLLLFHDDLAARQRQRATFLEAQARLGLGQRAAARRLLRRLLRADPSHGFAAELLDEARPPLS